MSDLPLKLQNKPFTLKEANELGLNFYVIKKLISLGQVEQIARGIYRASNIDLAEEEQYRISTLRVGVPSAICLISALSYYHLTDVIPKKTWIMVSDSKRTSDTTIKLFRSRNPQWKIGIHKKEGYAITSIERTIVDCLTQRSKIGTNTAISALKIAIENKQTTLHKILEMAKSLDVLHRILPYIEALS